MGAASARRENSSRSTPSSWAPVVSTRAALRVHMSGRCRPSAEANPAICPLASRVGVSWTAKTVPDVPRLTTTSPGCRPRPSAAPMLSPVPAPTTRPASVTPAGSAGPRTRGTPNSRPRARRWMSASYSPVTGDQYPVPLASPRSVVHPRKPPPASRMRPVSQSCGRTTVSRRAALSGSASRSHRTFATVNAATGTTSSRSTQAPAPPSSSTSSRAAPAERTSFHSNASRTTAPSESRATMPCC